MPSFKLGCSPKCRQSGISGMKMNVNLHWTKWGAMGHSSTKLIAFQRLTVSYVLTPLLDINYFTSFDHVEHAATILLLMFNFSIHIAWLFLSENFTLLSSYPYKIIYVPGKGHNITDFTSNFRGISILFIIQSKTMIIKITKISLHCFLRKENRWSLEEKTSLGYL